MGASLFSTVTTTAVDREDGRRLSEYSWNGRWKDVQELLQSRRESHRDSMQVVNAKDSLGFTALIGASKKGNQEIVRLLLDHGADVNGVNNDGYTALIWAAMFNQEAVVQLLVRHGADLNIQNNDGETALMCSCRNGDESLCRFLLTKGADPNTQEKRHGFTALTYASYNGHEHLIDILLEHGADTQLNTSSGKTIAEIARTDSIKQRLILHVTNSYVLK